MKKEYYKLVRDNIPKLMLKDNCNPIISILDNNEFEHELDKKLEEECKELIESHDISEFADVLEVLEAMVKEKGISWNDILKEKADKANKKGKFDKKIFLMYSEG